MHKSEQVYETQNKELQAFRRESGKSESIIEDLKMVNDELQSVIQVKSNFI